MEKHTIFDENLNLIEVEGNPFDHLDVDPQIRRIKEYHIGEQLNCLFDDIQAGLFGEAAKTGKFVSHIQAVKDRYPKS